MITTAPARDRNSKFTIKLKFLIIKMLINSIITTNKGAVVPGCQPSPWFAGTTSPRMIELKQLLDGTKSFS